MIGKNQLDLEECIYLKEQNEIDYLNDYIGAFVNLYGLYDPYKLVIMLDGDLDELFFDSEINTESVLNCNIEYDDELEIINKKEGEVIGKMILEQDGKRYTTDILVEDNGCMLSDGIDFKTIARIL